MTDFNLEWLEQNFAEKNAVIYNVGCADLTDDSLRFQVCVPHGKVFSFDCADNWKESNYNKSKNYNLHYLHKAVSFNDKKRTFVNGSMEYNGSLSNITELEKHKDWAEQIEVDVISINTFCESNPPPDVLHIDAEFEEYNILKNILPQNMPSVIWIENQEYYNDEDSNMSVPYAALRDLLIQQDYACLTFSGDSLFTHNKSEFTKYVDITHDVDHWTEHEKKIQTAIWILRYNLCKDDSWPSVTALEDFDLLPEHIQVTCDSSFNLRPDARFYS